jgi:predicted membrane protein
MRKLLLLGMMLVILWLAVISAIFAAFWFAAAGAYLANQNSWGIIKSLGLILCVLFMGSLGAGILSAIDGLFEESGPIGETLSALIQLCGVAAGAFIACIVLGSLGSDALWSSWPWMLGGVALALVGGLLGYFVLSQYA